MTEVAVRSVPDWLDVSRETIAQLKEFVQLLEKWNPSINLVSRNSVPEIWQRHVLDSAQMFDLIPAAAQNLVDLGSGAGFPGLVLAIMAQDKLPGLKTTLVESDQRKATFLAEAARQLSLPVTVKAERIEALVPQCGDVVTVRALAPLSHLCGHIHRHMHPKGLAIVAKGAQVETEIEAAQRHWSFGLVRRASRSDPGATLLVLTDLRHG